MLKHTLRVSGQLCASMSLCAECMGSPYPLKSCEGSHIGVQTGLQSYFMSLPVNFCLQVKGSNALA